MMKEKEENERSSKLQTVFTKLSGVLPEHETNSKMLDADLSVLTCPWRVSSEDSVPDDRISFITIASLASFLEKELRLAKRKHILCGEVLLPCGLLHRIACDIFSLSDCEPCGIRGCLIYLHMRIFDELRKLSSAKCDPETTTTFELNLILKEHSSRWQFLPQLFKNSTIVVSPDYDLNKKKLYRSNNSVLYDKTDNE